MRTLVVAVAVLVAGCTGATIEETTTTTSPAPTTTLKDLSKDLTAALAMVEDLGSQIIALDEEVAALEEEVRSMRSDRDGFREAFEAADAERDELLLKYDAEIQEAIAAGVPSIIETGCANVKGNERTNQITRLVRSSIEEWAGQAGLPEDVADQIDSAAVQRGIEACRDEVAEELKQARLRSPKGDGFYTVGVEIAAGTWESQGTGSLCYWARLAADQDILDNHFGNAGGRITIRSSDVEVEFDGCGTWEYQS